MHRALARLSPRSRGAISAEQSVDDLDLLCGFSPFTVQEGGDAVFPARITNNASVFVATGFVRWFRESDGAFVAEAEFFVGGGETVDVQATVSWSTLEARLGAGDHSLEAQLQDVEFF